MYGIGEQEMLSSIDTNSYNQRLQKMLPFKIKSQLSENQIESDVSSYLGYITPFWSKRYRLISIDEQLTGADKLFNRFLPIYLQFKVSQGLNPESNLMVQRFKNRPLANIVNYRSDNSLSGNPILYFQLRRKAITASDFQHNILRKLNMPPSQFALYVAPLVLEISEYEKILDSDWLMKLYPFRPFKYKEIEVLDDASLSKKLMLGSNPFLRHHISIPPHVTISTHNHHYSYSNSGGDLAWHGGETFFDDFRLSYQMHKIFDYVYNSDNFGFRRPDFVDFVQQFSKEHYFEDFRIGYRWQTNDSDQNSIIEEFIHNLKVNYNIKTLFLMHIE